MTDAAFDLTGGRYFILDRNRRPSRVGRARWEAQQATRAVILADDTVGAYRVVTRFPGRKLGTVDGESLWFAVLSGDVTLARAATAGEALRLHRFIVDWIGTHAAETISGLGSAVAVVATYKRRGMMSNPNPTNPNPAPPNPTVPPTDPSTPAPPNPAPPNPRTDDDDEDAPSRRSR